MSDPPPDDPLEQLARARDHVRVARREPPPPPVAQQQPNYVFMPMTPPTPPQRVSGDASAFRWGFGLMFGALCAVVAFFFLSCLGIRLLIEASTAGKSKSPPPPTPARRTEVAPQRKLVASPVLGADNKLRLEVANISSADIARVIVVVESRRVDGHAVRLTFQNVAAGQTASAVIESAILQRDAAEGTLPSAKVVEPAQ